MNSKGNIRTQKTAGGACIKTSRKNPGQNTAIDDRILMEQAGMTTSMVRKASAIACK